MRVSSTWENLHCRSTSVRTCIRPIRFTIESVQCQWSVSVREKQNSRTNVSDSEDKTRKPRTKCGKQGSGWRRFRGQVDCQPCGPREAFFLEPWTPRTLRSYLRRLKIPSRGENLSSNYPTRPFSLASRPGTSPARVYRGMCPETWSFWRARVTGRVLFTICNLHFSICILLS